MDNGWQDSADAWVADMGESGDFGRRYVLDPVMLPRAVARSPGNALDVGCGEGRFCRMLQSRGVEAVGVDPTPALVSVARTRDPRGTYVKATAERLPFREEAFDLVVSYLSLIDIQDVEAAVPEMARVLRPGGAVVFLTANMWDYGTLVARMIPNRFSIRLSVGPPVNDRYRSKRGMRAGEMYSSSPRCSFASVTGVSMS